MKHIKLLGAQTYNILITTINITTTITTTFIIIIIINDDDIGNSNNSTYYCHIFQMAKSDPYLAFVRR